MNREERILHYIKANPGCTKTMVENNTDMAEKTARNTLKQLIEINEVVCEIDPKNPRVHHLYINDVRLSRKKINNLILSKIEAQMRNQMFTTSRLDTGEWITVPVRTQFSPNYLPSVSEIIDAQLPKKYRAK